MLPAPADVGLDPGGLQRAAQLGGDLLDVAPALLPLGDQAGLDLAVLLRLDVLEGEVLQFRLELADAEAVGQRRVDLHRLQRLLALLVGVGERGGAHVVQAVGQLDEDHADVVDHRQDHLAQVLGLLRLLALAALVVPLVLPVERGGAAQLGDPLDQLGDARAELPGELLLGGAGVLDHVVQQGGGEGLGVELHLGEDARGGDGVEDVGLAALAPLLGVGLGGVGVGALDQVGVGARQLAVDDLQQGGHLGLPGAGVGAGGLRRGVDRHRRTALFRGAVLCGLVCGTVEQPTPYFPSTDRRYQDRV